MVSMVQPLIDKYVSQITGQGSPIGPDQMAVLHHIGSLIGAQGGMAKVPSEIERNISMARAPHVFPNLYSGGPGQTTTPAWNPQTGQWETIATGEHQENPYTSGMATVYGHFLSGVEKIKSDITKTEAEKAKDIAELEQYTKNYMNAHQNLYERLGGRRAEQLGAAPGNAGTLRRMKKSEWFKLAKAKPESRGMTDQQLEAKWEKSKRDYAGQFIFSED